MDFEQDKRKGDYWWFLNRALNGAWLLLLWHMSPFIGHPGHVGVIATKEMVFMIKKC